jgi:hypothetical protein
MKEEYDFTNAEQGKFYIPLDEIETPIYLDKDIASFFVDKLVLILRYPCYSNKHYISV